MDFHINRKRVIMFGVFSFVIFPCVLLLITGAVSPFISCFAVDSQNNLYVGLPRKIEVYNGDTLIETISPQTSHSYRFTILEDDTIWLSTSTQVYSMDLDGNILRSQEDTGAAIFNQLQHNALSCSLPNGDYYEATRILGRTQIVKNGTEVVYKIDFLSYVIKVLTGVGVLVIFVLSGCLLSELLRR